MTLKFVKVTEGQSEQGIVFVHEFMLVADQNLDKNILASVVTIASKQRMLAYKVGSLYNMRLRPVGEK